jgi:hypothetical protein
VYVRIVLMVICTNCQMTVVCVCVCVCVTKSRNYCAFCTNCQMIVVCVSVCVCVTVASVVHFALENITHLYFGPVTLMALYSYIYLSECNG